MTTPAPGGHPSLGFTGPFRVAAIRPKHFTLASATDAVATITTWASQLGTQSDETRRALDLAVFRALHEADAIYALMSLPEEARQEWGWVVGHAGFHEFAAVNRSRARPTLIVASDD